MLAFSKGILLFFLFLISIKCGSILNIPLKSLTNSNIVFSDLDSDMLETLVFNGNLDYNQYYIHFTIIGQESRIRKLSLDTTLNTNIFTGDSCEDCSENALLYWNTTYKRKKVFLKQFSSSVLLNDDNNLILPDFAINMEISSEKAIEIALDGVLGLGLQSFSNDLSLNPLNSSRNSLNNSSQSSLNSMLKSSNLLNYLYRNSYIDSRQFSFALYRDQNLTKLILGGYDSSLLKTPFRYHPLINPKKWMLNLTGLSIDKSLFPTHAKNLVFDSSVSNLIGPKADIVKIIGLLNQKAQKQICEEKAVFFMKCDCRNFPISEFFFEIAFEISGVFYQFFLEDLLISYQENTEECNFALSYSEGKTGVSSWILGTKFFERYYVMFDADRREIAISEVNIDVLMGNSFLSEEDMENLGLFGFVLLLGTLIYFAVYVLNEGKSSKEFKRVSIDEKTTYLEEGDVFVIEKLENRPENLGESIEMKEIKREKNTMILEGKYDKNEGKTQEKVENIEDSHTI